MSKDKSRMVLATLGGLLGEDLEDAMIAATPGSIEAQEAQGQRDFVKNTTLPRECLYCTQEQLEQVGIVYGDPVGELFVHVTLPPDWTKQSTDYSMWSDLLDEKGRKRADIFYWAGFYGRRAHISLRRRYSYQIDPFRRCCTFTDNGQLIGKSPGHVCGQPCNYAVWYEELEQIGRRWLDDRYPDWRDPLAYWEV